MKTQSFLLASLCLIPSLLTAEVRVKSDSPQAAFAKEILEATGIKFELTLSLDQNDDSLKPEGFRITKEDHSIHITAVDPAGLMYGGLEVSELLKIDGAASVEPGIHEPYMAMRGIKFNAPLDARTPSYSDASDAAQANIPEMWSFDFWRETIDTLARSRYNYISLWSLHPFPSLVKVPGYEKVALDDVHRSRTIREKEHYSLWAVGTVTPEILKDAEVVRKMTIDEKIAFWRKVMAYGKSRNIDFYFITWNIFTDGTFGQYGITDDIKNPITRDYFRKSVKEMFTTYPDLAGIGLTTGENMHKQPMQAKEDWAFATYGQGVLDATKAEPGRKIRFIHRQHQADSQAILDTFKPLVDNPDIDFIFSFKYAKAHVYSSTNQHYHQNFVKDLAPRKVKTIWTLRNDDTFYFRWGSPDFVREFISNIPYEVSQGYYLGSDQWIWGREFLHRDGPGMGEPELIKHEYQWMLWGRLGYDPKLSNNRIAAWLAQRFELPLDDALTLQNAWQNSSFIYPAVTGFHWGALDFQWYIEGCQSREGHSESKTGFHDVNRFISLPPHPLTGYQSIPDFVAGKKPERTNPMELAARISDYAAEAERLSATLKPAPNSELERVLTDIRIVATMGHYYSNKIRGATELALFQKTKDSTHRNLAITALAQAARDWKSYTEIVVQHYKNPLWTNRVGYVDLRKSYLATLEDIRLAGGDPAAEGLPPTITVESQAVSRPWESRPSE
jgi:hypothetical protein